jgi:excisionase family DNA binding protein
MTDTIQVKTVGGSEVQESELLTVEQVAEYLKVHPETVRKWLRAGEMAGINLGGAAGWRVTPSDLEKFVADHRRGQ